MLNAREFHDALDQLWEEDVNAAKLIGDKVFRLAKLHVPWVIGLV